MCLFPKNKTNRKKISSQKPDDNMLDNILRILYHNQCYVGTGSEELNGICDKNCLDWLVQEGYIEEVSNGLFHITENGINFCEGQSFSNENMPLVRP